MNGKFVGEINKQAHSPPQDQAEVTKIKASIKRRSQAIHDTPLTNVETTLQNFSETAAVNLPQPKACDGKRMIYLQHLYVEKIFLCCQRGSR